MALLGIAFAPLDRPFYQYRMHPGSYTLSGADSGEDPFMFECRSLAERYIHSHVRLPAAKYFRAWHSQIVNEQILTAYRKRGVLRMFRYMLIGLRYNLKWPACFMGKVFERLSLLPSRRSNRDRSQPAG